MKDISYNKVVQKNRPKLYVFVYCYSEAVLELGQRCPKFLKIFVCELVTEFTWPHKKKRLINFCYWIEIETRSTVHANSDEYEGLGEKWLTLVTWHNKRRACLVLFLINHWLHSQLWCGFIDACKQWWWFEAVQLMICIQPCSSTTP
jgi:hypothetical protein